MARDDEGIFCVRLEYQPETPDPGRVFRGRGCFKVRWSTLLRLDGLRPDDLRVHPGRDWFTVLSGTIVLRLGERTILVGPNEAAEFSTMVPHAFGAHGGPAEILCILDHEGERSHLGPHGEADHA